VIWSTDRKVLFFIILDLYRSIINRLLIYESQTMKIATILMSLLVCLLLSSPAFSYTLSGTISGAEFLGGITYVYAISLDSLTIDFHIGLALFGTGTYYVPNVPAGTYLLTAFQDRDGTLTPTVDDYMGYYGGTTPTPVVVTGNTSNLDITVAPLPFTGITGTITCPEGHSGATLILAATDPLFQNVTNYGFLTVLTGNGDYSLFVDPGQYYVLAYLEEDYNLGRSPGDPQTFWGTPGSPTLIDVTEGSVDNINLNLIAPPTLTLTLTPPASPVVISPHGGTFTYNLAVQNQGTTAVPTSIWCDAILPNGQLSSPLLGPVQITLPVGFNGNRNRNQTLPASAPAGDYTFYGHVGVYPVIVWAEDSFPITKTGIDNQAGLWSSSWLDSDWNSTPSTQPIIAPDFIAFSANPNPFNPTTHLTYTLQKGGWVTLAIYDMAGRRVTTLVDGFRPTGTQQVTFDGSNLTSGVYFYQLAAEGASTQGKLLLIK
jgi:hypothetical protein